MSETAHGFTMPDSLGSSHVVEGSGDGPPSRIYRLLQLAMKELEDLQHLQQHVQYEAHSKASEVFWRSIGEVYTSKQIPASARTHERDEQDKAAGEARVQHAFDGHDELSKYISERSAECEPSVVEKIQALLVEQHLSTHSRSSTNSWVSDSYEAAGLNERLKALRRKFARKVSITLNHEHFDEDSRVLFSKKVHRKMKRIYDKPWLEPVFAALIFLNAMCMIAEFQYDGIQLSRSLGFSSGQQILQESSFKTAVFDSLEWFFGLVFAAELAFKVLVKGLPFFKDVFAVVDLVTVVFFVIERIVGSMLPVGSAWLRICRLVRLARLLRLVRTVEELDHLYLMTTAIKGSISVLAWALLLLFVIQMTIALVIGQFLHAVYFGGGSESIDISEKTQDELEQMHKIFEYFGTWTRAMLSMFEITLANWPPICRMLTEEVSEWFTLVCLVHKLTIGFAVVGVINGVFMQETFKVAATDDMIMVRQKTKMMESFRENMLRLFNALDRNSDGLVSKAEFKSLGKFPEVKTWLSSMEIHIDDLGSMFDLIDDDRKGFISFEELMKGMSKLRGNARSIDLMLLMEKHEKGLNVIKQNNLVPADLGFVLASPNTSPSRAPSLICEDHLSI